jgi:hypothetical protein
MPQFDGFPVGELLRLRPRNKFFQQSRVGFLRVLGLPAFVPQELQKIFNERLHQMMLAPQASRIKLQIAGSDATMFRLQEFRHHYQNNRGCCECCEKVALPLLVAVLARNLIRRQIVVSVKQAWAQNTD